MDAAHILVAVLTTAAVGWLVWIEFQCPRNHVSLPQNEFGTGNDESVIAAEG